MVNKNLIFASAASTMLIMSLFIWLTLNFYFPSSVLYNYFVISIISGLMLFIPAFILSF